MDRIELLKRVSKLLPRVPAQELGKVLDVGSYLSFPQRGSSWGVVTCGE